MKRKGQGKGAGKTKRWEKMKPATPSALRGPVFMAESAKSVRETQRVVHNSTRSVCVRRSTVIRKSKKIIVQRSLKSTIMISWKNRIQNFYLSS
jgi:hypothetical protein